MLNLIKSTQLKLWIAKNIFRVLNPFFGGKRIITRGGIKFEIDISEGIDLNLFLLGNFQKHVYKNAISHIKQDAAIIDVGGNVGAISLFLAKDIKQGHVYAFEPTTFALDKFQRNIELNPDLASRITLYQSFVSSQNEEASALEAYSSWKLDEGTKKHAVHGGTIMSSENVPSTTIDSFCKSNNILRIDFIKIDTDGHEYDVLKGAKETIRKYKPDVVFEVGLYILEEQSINFIDILSFFEAIQYEIYTIKGKRITENNFERLIPSNGTIDAIGTPSRS